jgi:hypothetical protein
MDATRCCFLVQQTERSALGGEGLQATLPAQRAVARRCTRRRDRVLLGRRVVR